MSKKVNKSVSKPSQPESEPLYALGIDDKDKSRGARFTSYDDRLVSALLDMGLTVVNLPSAAFAEAAKRLPEGRRYASGKMFMPPVKQALIDELHAIIRQPGDTSHALRIENWVKAGDDGQVEVDTTVRCTSPMLSGLPHRWDDIDVGHLVVAHASPENGWWEAICVKRAFDVLTLRWRDAPREPLFERHVTTVALINPGPFAEAAK